MASSQYSPQRPSNQPSSEPKPAQPIPGYSDDEARDIYARAAEIQSKSLFEDDKLTPEMLERSANRAGISDVALRQAIKERERERVQILKNQKQRALKKARLTKNGIVAASVFAAVSGLTLWNASSTLGARQQEMRAAQSQVENVKERRYNLVPNLIAVTKATLKNEDKLIDNLQNATEAAKNAAPEAQTAAQANLKSTIDKTLETLHSQKVASPVVMLLGYEMAGAENRIAVENRKLIQATEKYNNAARGFPTGFAGRLLGYPANYPYFQASKNAREAPRFDP